MFGAHDKPGVIAASRPLLFVSTWKMCQSARFMMPNT